MAAGITFHYFTEIEEYSGRNGARICWCRQPGHGRFWKRGTRWACGLGSVGLKGYRDRQLRYEEGDGAFAVS